MPPESVTCGSAGPAPAPGTAPVEEKRPPTTACVRRSGASRADENVRTRQVGTGRSGGETRLSQLRSGPTASEGLAAPGSLNRCVPGASRVPRVLRVALPLPGWSRSRTVSTQAAAQRPPLAVTAASIPASEDPSGVRALTRPLCSTLPIRSSSPWPAVGRASSTKVAVPSAAAATTRSPLGGKVPTGRKAPPGSRRETWTRPSQLPAAKTVPVDDGGDPLHARRRRGRAEAGRRGRGGSEQGQRHGSQRRQQGGPHPAQDAAGRVRSRAAP